MNMLFNDRAALISTRANMAAQFLDTIITENGEVQAFVATLLADIKREADELADDLDPVNTEAWGAALADWKALTRLMDPKRHPIEGSDA